MKKIINYIAIYLLMVLASILIASFVLADLNIFSWDSETRAHIVFMPLCVVFGLVVLNESNQIKP